MKTNFKFDDIIIRFEYTYDEVQDIVKKFRGKKLTDDEIYDMQKGVGYIIPDDIESAIYNSVMNR